MIEAIKLVLSVGGFYIAFEPVVESDCAEKYFEVEQQMVQRTADFYDKVFRENFKVHRFERVMARLDENFTYSGYVIYVLGK